MPGLFPAFVVYT